MTEAWAEAAQEAASDSGVSKTKGKRSFGLSPKTRQAIRRRTTLYYDVIHNAPGLEEARNSWEAYEEAKVCSRELLEEDKRVR